jgi:hypothetical protein
VPVDPQWLRPRWRGQAGRLEVWYATLTDPATGTGVWLHHELVAPVGGPAPSVHGWLAIFPPDQPATVARYGPNPVAATAPGGVPSAGDVVVHPDTWVGEPGELGWQLSVAGHAPPLFAVPRWAWRSAALPAVHVVAAPSARFTGRVGALRMDDAPGAVAHLYGHGSPARWGWLHADLGNGDVLELIAAVARTPPLTRLPPVVFLRLRRDGRDWPRWPTVAALSLRARLGLPRWSVAGTVHGRRLSVQVDLPADRVLRVGYVDPDGATATCVHSSRADALISITDGSHTFERALAGTAHAEVGLRP